MKQALGEDHYCIFLPEKSIVIIFYRGWHLLEVLIWGFCLISFDVLEIKD